MSSADALLVGQGRLNELRHSSCVSPVTIGGKLDIEFPRSSNFSLGECLDTPAVAGMLVDASVYDSESRFWVSPRFCICCRGAERAFFLTIFHECFKLHCLL